MSELKRTRSPPPERRADRSRTLMLARTLARSRTLTLELDRDRTASGERLAALARALIPTEASKAETWARLTGDDKLPNWLQRSMLQGFHHPSQLFKR